MFDLFDIFIWPYQQGPSASAYVTYCLSNDGLRAIQSVNNIIIDSRLIKTSLGTTKYCSHFMKNQSCPKPDCMYLHELGDPEASFTKEEMHLGKHQEYEKRLHDQLIAATAEAVAAAAAFSANELAASEAAAVRHEEANASAASSAAIAANGGGSKDAWPSLSVSPVNNKELAIKVANGGKSNGKDSNSKKTKDRSKNKKDKAQAAAALTAAGKSAALLAAAKAVASSANTLPNKLETEMSAAKIAATTRSSSSESSGDNSSSARASTTSSSSTPDISTDTTSSTPDIGFDTESKVSAVDTPKSMMMGVDEELNLISEIENDALLGDELDEKLETPSPLG